MLDATAALLDQLAELGAVDLVVVEPTGLLHFPITIVVAAVLGRFGLQVDVEPGAADLATVRRLVGLAAGQADVVGGDLRFAQVQLGQLAFATVLGEGIPLAGQVLAVVEILSAEPVEGAAVGKPGTDRIAGRQHELAVVALQHAVAAFLGEVAAQVLVGAGAAALAVGDAELHQRRIGKLHARLDPGFAVMGVMLAAGHAQGVAGRFQGNLVAPHLAVGAQHQRPALLDVGHDAAGSEHRVGRVQPPGLAVHLGADDGMVRRVHAGHQQVPDHVAAADQGRFGLDPGGLEHGAEEDRQVLAVAIAIALDLRQGERHVAALAGAPVAQVAVGVVDVLHQAGDLLAGRLALHRGDGRRGALGQLRGEDLVVARGERAEVVLQVQRTAQLQARGMAQVGVAGFVDVVGVLRLFQADLEGLLVGALFDAIGVHQLAAHEDRPLGLELGDEAVVAHRHRRAAENVVELGAQRLGGEVLAQGVADAGADAQVGERQGGLAFAQEALVRVRRGARIDLRLVQRHRLAAGLGQLGLLHDQAIGLRVAAIDAREHLAAARLEDGEAVGAHAIGAVVGVELAAELGFAGQRRLGDRLQRGEGRGGGAEDAGGEEGRGEGMTGHRCLRMKRLSGAPRRRLAHGGAGR